MLADALLLVGAGVLAGLLGSIAGLASLASYPALLAVGLSPVAANVTNTVALVFTGLGAGASSRTELVGQGARVRSGMVLTGVGGALGAVLLLAAPPGVFEAVVPWLIGLASVTLLAQPRIRAWALRTGRAGGGGRGTPVLVATFAVSVYGGYFGAAAGVLLLALLLLADGGELLRANALKNLLLLAANAVAAVGFAVFGPVVWSAALPLAVGCLLGGLAGPWVGRRVPTGALRVAIALAGLGLALRLGLS
ncbi:sulfite exporter TauE/SafE family protein [Rhodococcus aerolatus]